jgi:hypothetical protein
MLKVGDSIFAKIILYYFVYRKIKTAANAFVSNYLALDIFWYIIAAFVISLYCSLSLYFSFHLMNLSWGQKKAEKNEP